MAEGITTVIPDEGLFDARMRMVTQDARSIVRSGQPVRITVGAYVARGSLEQNALFHALCDHIAQWWNARHPEQPTTKERIKTDLKQTYGVILTEYSPLDDKRKPRLASWSEYSRAQRNALITATLAWMADSGCPDLPTLPPAEYERYREAKRA